MPTVKSPEERGPVAAWAYESRTLLDLSPEAVVHMLGKYNAATLRKAEADSKDMSRPLWKAISSLYLRLARERGLMLAASPVISPSAPPPPTDIGALVAAISDLVTEMRLSREREQDAAAAMLRAAGVLLEARQTSAAAESTAPDVPLGTAG